MSASRRPQPAKSVRRRPKDRKVQIAKASSDAFSESGYHAVSMEEIASRVGISAPALYRHSASKYDLFRDAVLGLGHCLVDATDPLHEADADPRETLRALIDGLIETTIAHRTAGGLFRWEARYLKDEDQVELANQIKLVNRRIQKPLESIRPALTSHERWTLSSAALSVIGSITDHRAALPIPEIRTVLAELAAAVLYAELPTPPPHHKIMPSAPPVTVDAGPYEMLLHESMRLFNVNGYRETSMEDIATAIGIPVSGIYRYFPSKADMLAASFRRAADRISGDVSRALSETTAPEAALERLVAGYVARSFERPELGYVYYTERINLPAADQAILHHIQRSTVESWTKLLLSARPEISPGHARFAVHAGFTLVVDLGRLVQYDNTEHAQASVRCLMEAALLGRPIPVSSDERPAGAQSPT
ncbi:TetR/AcrR family transcriptional regulator [Mycobacteroides chelonae]|uniref:TetR family transcriptional regulator n=1 Tax=Mycobacteroides chelonae TaxID=1774 RepID=A0AB73N6L0_MYCCH|nr:TetR/AcrR family transcriptional regulator [Mycobacteroides chelonae]MBF9326806.1 TetR/AcrR family transcriptional regulator [Mycobacteroides chelonae]MBF9420983.1 TetR/AcrR family transcriptional regulator [Mycobacteroides chelonae]MBF9436826.1 TetR/AcrR family transcriptional regulator [Mycobacteroides chelonae]MEC4833593.1 TetR/AcrR family transcriptional regulator [Mycobacteroides chelonae]MEC4857570.1 TetR/AcrR family transcriptional regulator [Mycobacteroides chelonae]